MGYEVKAIRFRQIYPRATADVPLDLAWARYERQPQGHEEITRAICIDDKGREFETWAKSYSIWDRHAKVHRLTRIGLGANGDYGPRNPVDHKRQLENYDAKARSEAAALQYTRIP